MKKLNEHEQARHWIQARLDRSLDKPDEVRLESHLRNCAACRRYSDQIDRLDADLLKLFRSQSPVLNNPPLQAIYSIVSQSRAKMKAKRVVNLANSAVLPLLLVAMVGGLALLISVFRAKDQPVQPAIPAGGGIPAAQASPSSTNVISTLQPSPTPRSTPTQSGPTTTSEWTTASPLTITQEIITVLDGLARSNVERLHTPLWIHTVRTSLGSQGSMQTTTTDEWAHYNNASMPCPEKLVVVKDRPGGDKIYQIQIMLLDGTSADLVALREGVGKVDQVSPEDPACTLGPESVEAGVLMLRLAGNYPGTAVQYHEESLKSAKAWYEPVDGVPAFTVEAAFEMPPTSSIAPRIVETYSFMLESGMTLRHGVRLEQPDGTLIGETLDGYQTEFRVAMPADLAQEFEQYKAELKAYAEKK